MKKILMTSDTHWWEFNGYAQILEEFFYDARMQCMPDVILHAGDWTSCNQYELDRAFKQIRTHFPKIPILAVLGNHDHWSQMDIATLSESKFMQQMRDREDLFRKYNITHLNASYKVIGDIAFFGFDGWYSSVTPPTNDHKYLPKIIQGMPTHLFMMEKARKDFEKVLELANDEKFKNHKKVLVSHFPTYGEPDGFGAPLSWHQFVVETFDIVHYGHTHLRIEDKIEGKCSINNAGAGWGREFFPQYILKKI